jgi:hypothetical protein
MPKSIKKINGKCDNYHVMNRQQAVILQHK